MSILLGWILIIALYFLILTLIINIFRDMFMCSHDWKFGREVKERVDNDDKYPTHIYKIYQCSKCKKIKKVKVI